MCFLRVDIQHVTWGLEYLYSHIIFLMELEYHKKSIVYPATIRIILFSIQ